jgi:hypothetical protein
VQLRESPVGNVKTIRPDQPTVPPDPPGICDVPANYFFSVGSAAEHEPFERNQLRSRADIYLRLPSNARSIEDDGLLREPCEFCGLVRRKPCRDARWTV